MSPVKAHDSTIKLPEILQAVQTYVDFLRNNVRDFVSREEITIEEFDNRGRINKTTEIISEFRVTPVRPELRKPGRLFLYTIPQEERTLLSVRENDKPRRNTNFSEPAFLVGLNPFNDLLVIFDKRNEEYFNYRLNGIETISGRKAYVIEIEQKEAEIGNTTTFWWIRKYEGVAHIDVETMDVLKLNRGRHDFRPGARHLRYLGRLIGRNVSMRLPHYHYYEYKKVNIGNQYYTLPVERTSRLYHQDGRIHTIFRYRYSDHRVFTVDTNIKFDFTDESLNDQLIETEESNEGIR